MAIIDMGIRDHVYQLSGLHVTYLSDHHEKQSVLRYVPVVGGQYIVASLVQDGIQGKSVFAFFLDHVEGHGIGARIQAHFVQILMHIDVSHDPTAVRIVFKIVKHPVHLIHHAFFVLMLYTQLVAIGLADGTVFVCPAVPDMAAQIFNIVGFFLPDPEDLVKSVFEACLSQGQGGEFFPQVVAVDYAETFYGVGKASVVPFRSYFFAFCAAAVVEDVTAHGFEYFICFAHLGSPFLCMLKYLIIFGHYILL